MNANEWWRHGWERERERERERALVAWMQAEYRIQGCPSCASKRTTSRASRQIWVTHSSWWAKWHKQTPDTQRTCSRCWTGAPLKTIRYSWASTRLLAAGLYVSICVHIYLYVSIYVHMSIYVYICPYVSIYICLYVYIYIYICPYLSMCLYICLYISIYIYICLCVHIYLYISIYIYICPYMSIYLYMYVICVYIVPMSIYGHISICVYILLANHFSKVHLSTNQNAWFHLPVL